MSDVKWIKISTDMFNNRKIKQIRKLPEGDAIVVTWVQILCLAGQINDNGLMYFSKDIPFTDEMLATEFDRPISTIRLALATFEKFEMIEIVDNILMVSNWEKYQSQNKLETIKEYNREKKREYRLKQKEKLSLTCPGQVLGSPQTDIDLDIDKEDIYISQSEDDLSEKKVDKYLKVLDLYHQICFKLPKVVKLTSKRKTLINKLLIELSLEQIEKGFNEINNSNFCNGTNDRGWKADFDFCIRVDKLTNALEGKYSNATYSGPNNQVPMQKSKYKEL